MGEDQGVSFEREDTKLNVKDQVEVSRDAQYWNGDSLNDSVCFGNWWVHKGNPRERTDIAAAVKSQGEGYQFSGPSRDLHHDLGLVLFLLVMIQVAM